MRFTHITLDNFLSYDTQELDLQGLDYVAIAGRNGSGKSSLALAIAWALFGTARVKGDSDSVIRDGQSACGVVLEFVSEGTAWRIARTKKRTKSAKVRLYSQDDEGEWQPYGDHLNATAQGRIEDLVGMSEDSFYSLTIIDGDSGVRFIKADSHQRRDILLNLLPEMGVWSDMEDKAREMLASAKSSVEVEQTRLHADEEHIVETRSKVAEAEAEYDDLSPDSLRETLPQVEADIGRLVKTIDGQASEEKTRLENAERAHDSRKRELRSEANAAKVSSEGVGASARTIRTLVADKKDATDEVAERDDEIKEAKVAAREADREFSDLDKRRPEVKTLKSKAADEAAQVAVLNASIATNKKSLTGLTQMQDDNAAQCPTCQTHLDSDSLESLVAQIEDALDIDKKDADKHAKAAKVFDADADALRDEINAAADAADAAEDKVERLEEKRKRALDEAKRYADRISEFLNDNDFEAPEDVDNAAKKAEKLAVAAEESYKDYVDDSVRDLDRLRTAFEDAVEASATGKDAERLAAMRESKRDLSEKIRTADNLSGRIETLRSSIRDTSSAMRERQDSIKGAVDSIEALEQVVSACRPQGVPSMLLDGVLAPIEAEATRILNGVPGGEGMMLRFEQARALKSRAGAREVLDIVVTLPTGVERPIESLSSGETVRVAMSLVFSMISVLGARRGGDALDTVFLDEPLGTLDGVAVPAFVEVLRSAVSSGTLSSVMVVTHDQRIIDALPQRIEVEREETGVSVACLVA